MRAVPLLLLLHRNTSACARSEPNPERLLYRLREGEGPKEAGVQRLPSARAADTADGLLNQEFSALQAGHGRCQGAWASIPIASTMLKDAQRK